MTLRLNGSTSGYTEIDAPATAGNNNLKLPTGNGSDGNILGTDGAGNLSWVNGRMVLETAKASTSGTSVDFIGIPSWVKKITVMLNGVSTNGTSGLLVQIGAGSFTTSGYSSTSTAAAANVATTNSTTGFIVRSIVATYTASGSLGIFLVSPNVYVSSHTCKVTTTETAFGGGDVTLSGTLDRIRITTVNGTDTFDAGSINILYEG